MLDWAQAYGKTLKVRNVRQDTCSYRPGNLPLYAYEQNVPMQDPLELDLDDQIDEYSEDEKEEVLDHEDDEAWNEEVEEEEQEFDHETEAPTPLLSSKNAQEVGKNCCKPQIYVEQL